LSSGKYVGLDVHQATISVGMMDSAGKTDMECILQIKAATFLQFIAAIRGTLSVTLKGDLVVRSA
jgi:hypothetical protein